MDKQEEKDLHTYIDTAVEDEINRNYTVEKLPDDLVHSLEQAHHDTPEVSPFTHIKFTRLTPRKQRLIKSAVSKLYYKDVQDDAILSNGQLLEINKKRGEWDNEREKNIEQLQGETGVLMRLLYSGGIQASQEWGEDLEKLYDKMEEDLEASEKPQEFKAHFKMVLDRWLNYTEAEQEMYDSTHGKEQELEVYSLDRDLVYLTTEAPTTESSENIVLLDEITYKIRQSIVLLSKQEKLRDLLEDRYKIFNDSVESRRDINESMSRIFYGAASCNEEGDNVEFLAEDMDGLFDFPEDVIQWLLNESYMFNEAVPKETRDLLEAWGFIKTEQKDSGSSPPSEELPDLPQDSEDSPQQEADVSTLALVPQQT